MKMLIKKRGFTLVELMIVVAIIGILSAIAIPNFIRFQARSKQSEAKTNLKAIFTGQKSRFADRDAYADLIGEIGFSPERGNRYSYDLGPGDMTAATNAGIALSCMNPEVRDAATVAIAAAPGYCGVGADVFRYMANIVPTLIGGRGAVTWATAVAGNDNLPVDGIGYNAAMCPNCDFGAKAVGNVDNDASADEFFVSSQFGSMVAGACAEAIDVMNQDQPGAAINAQNDVSCEF